MTRSIKNIGEYRLVHGLVKRVSGSGRSRKTRVGIGDDAFVFKAAPGKDIVVSTDALVSGVHFSQKYMSWRSIGRKAMLVNLSDLAAMGKVRPLFAFVSCGMKGSFPLKNCEDLFRGLAEAAEEHGAVIAGGDTVSSNGPLFVSVTVIGEAYDKDIVTRSGAGQGDALFVSGLQGLSALGLYILNNKPAARKLSAAERAGLIRSHLDPKPRFFESGVLVKSGLASSMIDSSDGLEVSVREIARMSGVGARIDLDSLADNAYLRRICGKLKIDPVRYCLSGGEDYTLIFTVPKEKAVEIMRRLPGAVRVGEITAKGSGVKYFNRGKRVHPRSGFKHF